MDFDVVHFDLSSSLSFFLHYFLEVDFLNLIFIWSFLAGFFQSQAFLFIHLRWPKLGYAYNTEQDTTSLRDDVQFSREVPFTYISSNFIMFFCLTCSYRHSKLKKGMEVQEHIKKQLKLYKNTFCQLFHCKIKKIHCPNFKPLFPAVLKIDFVLIL